jgi:hypothetical protein
VFSVKLSSLNVVYLMVMMSSVDIIWVASVVRFCHQVVSYWKVVNCVIRNWLYDINFFCL